VIDQVTFTEQEWLNFWKYFNSELHQEAAIEMLRQHILKIDPCLLTATAEWVEVFRAGPASGRTSPKGVALIKEFEGLRLQSYYCASGVLTIGYGSTGQHVYPGQVISEEVAEDLLRLDLGRFEDGVRELVKVDITTHEFDALVSFSFNTGVAALEHSTLLRRLNAGEDKPTVFKEELPRWVNGSNGPLPGLVRRRQAEIDLALS
jgi:lysozyme